MSSSLGLDFQVFSLSLAIQNLVIGLTQPFVAAYADRFGTARTVAVSGILYMAGMLILANASKIGNFFILNSRFFECMLCATSSIQARSARCAQTIFHVI